jgi:hypothetical protein
MGGFMDGDGEKQDEETDDDVDDIHVLSELYYNKSLSH